MDPHYIRPCVAVRQCIAPSRSSPQQRRRLLHRHRKIAPVRTRAGADGHRNGRSTPVKGRRHCDRSRSQHSARAAATVHWIANFADSSYHQKLSALAKSLGCEFVASVAVACATPVVAVAEGGVRESIRNGVNGVLIPERRPEQIGQELLSFLETSSYARDISLASRQGLARDPSRGQVG